MDDPTLSIALLLAHGWTAVLCLWAGCREVRARRTSRGVWIWALLTVILGLLALHHATGLGTMVTELFRRQAQRQGWYWERRGLQTELVLLVPCAAMAAGAALLWRVRQSWRRYLPAVFSLAFLAGLGAVQLISLHGVDALMRTALLGLRLSTWLNLLGLALVVLAVVWSEHYYPIYESRRRPRAPAKPEGRVMRLLRTKPWLFAVLAGVVLAGTRLASGANAQVQRQPERLKLAKVALAASVDLGEVTIAYRMTPVNRSVNAGLQLFARREDPAGQGQWEMIAPTAPDGKPLILHLFEGMEAAGTFKVPLKKGSYGPVRLVLFRSPDGMSVDYGQLLYDAAEDPAAPKLALDVTVRTEQKRVVQPILGPARVSESRGAGGSSTVTVTTDVRLPAAYEVSGGGFWVMAKGLPGFSQVWAGADQAQPGRDPLDNYRTIPVALKLEGVKPGLWTVELGLFRSNFGDPLQWVYPGVDFEVGGDSWIVRAPADRVPPRLRVRSGRFVRLDGTPHNFYPDHPGALSGVKFVRGGNYGNAITWTIRPALNQPGYFTLLRSLGCRWIRFNFNPDRFAEEPLYQHAVEQVVENILSAGLYPVIAPQGLPKGASTAEQVDKGLAVVRTMATLFRGKSVWLEVCNEPHEFKTWEGWKPVAVRYAKAIRQVDPEAFVIVPFEDFGKDGRAAAKDPIREVAVDLYDGHAYVAPEQLATLYGPALAAGLPVMIGEYGGGGPYLKQMHTALQSLSPAPLAAGPWAFTVAGQDSLPLIADGSTAELRFTEAGTAVASDFELWLSGKVRK